MEYWIAARITCRSHIASYRNNPSELSHLCLFALSGMASFMGQHKMFLFLKSIHRAANPGRATVKYMGIDHRSLHVAMAQQFLGGPNIVNAFH